MGALVATSLFSSICLQIRKSGGTLEELRRVNKEFHRKLLKGAPCPPGLERDVSDDQVMVFGRPGSWRAAEGDGFKFETPARAGN